ncbi:MAG TPA: aminotransferase class I/II-fold pyridoxal phosphate-dependent enzyme [Azospirillaceae bacterium]|nr:aminotransferase class I/II-fold pyridoxal phosphate-dependent enzyme [Azospirillaceae bacterium]
MGPIARNAVTFAEDDYDDVNATYFADILRDRSWSALPAGWLNPESAACMTFPVVHPPQSELQHYALDEGLALSPWKTKLLDLLSHWEGREMSYDEVSLSSSVTAANLCVLIALKQAGIRTLIFETPAYFSTLDQAQLLGFDVHRLPTYRRDGFELRPEQVSRAIAGKGRCALFLTQPRFGIGSIQPLRHLLEIVDSLRPHDVLVIDEAAEQIRPSPTAGMPAGLPVIRTRGLFKGLGVNGLRISAILHPPKWRATIQRGLDPSGSSIDRYSLHNAVEMAGNLMLFDTLLQQANRQVVESRRHIEIMALGTWVTPSPLEDSYIGSAFLDLRGLPGSYGEKRVALLEFCQSQRMPVVLGASIGFALDEDFEAVRLNYFTSRQNITKAMETLIAGHPELLARLSSPNR